MRVDVEQTVAHPVSRVFAVMSDPASRPLWQENTSDVEVITPGPAAVGTRWRETTRGIGRVEAQVIGFERDALWQESGEADGGSGHITVRLSPEGEAATRVSVTVELRLKGLRRVMEAALEPLVARQLPSDIRRLEALLDGGHEPAA